MSTIDTGWVFASEVYQLALPRSVTEAPGVGQWPAEDLGNVVGEPDGQLLSQTMTGHTTLAPTYYLYSRHSMDPLPEDAFIELVGVQVAFNVTKPHLVRLALGEESGSNGIMLGFADHVASGEAETVEDIRPVGSSVSPTWQNAGAAMSAHAFNELMAQARVSVSTLDAAGTVVAGVDAMAMRVFYRVPPAPTYSGWCTQFTGAGDWTNIGNALNESDGDAATITTNSAATLVMARFDLPQIPEQERIVGMRLVLELSADEGPSQIHYAQIIQDGALRPGSSQYMTLVADGVARRHYMGHDTFEWRHDPSNDPGELPIADLNAGTLRVSLRLITLNPNTTFSLYGARLDVWTAAAEHAMAPAPRRVKVLPGGRSILVPITGVA